MSETVRDSKYIRQYTVGGEKRDTTGARRMDRIKFAILMLVRAYRDYEIRKTVAEHFQVSRRCASYDLALARRLLVRQYSDRTWVEQRADILGMYDEILRDNEMPIQVKLTALTAKREILGLDAPKRAHVELRAEVEAKHTFKTVVQAAEEDEETRDLVLELSRRLSFGVDKGNN